MQVYFEACGQFITAAEDDGKVQVRCNFEYTDCGESEDLLDFISRHGGEVQTAQYLGDCYSTATRI